MRYKYLNSIVDKNTMRFYFKLHLYAILGGTLPTEYILGGISLVTSAVAGIIGFGGGMLLIAILPIYLSPSLIVPIHGMTQLASNSSRMLFSLKDVKWALLPKFLAGSLVGILIFGFFLSTISTQYVPIAIGLYIIFSLWNKRFTAYIKKFENYYLIGLLQSGLGLLVGATGPLSQTVLTRELNSKDQIIATSSMFMTISHCLKIVFFMMIGASLFEHIVLLAYMVTGSIVGSFIGTKIRLASDNDKLILIIKVLLSALALRMLLNSFI